MTAERRCGATSEGAEVRRRTTYSRRMTLVALALGVCASAALLLTAGSPPSASAHAGSNAVLGPATNTPTATATGTATATATTAPASLSLLSPTSARGPVGANITIAGSGFAGSNATVFASQHAACDNQVGVLGNAPVSSGGSISAYTFIWPTSLPIGLYYICASGVAGGPAYNVISNSPPAISLSTTNVRVGDELTISGSGFFTPGISLTLQQGPQTHLLGPIGPADDGHFSYTYQVDATFTNDVTVVAASNPENGAPPALKATAFLRIAPVPTVTATGTAASDVTPSVVVSPASPPKDTGPPTGLIVFLIVGIVLALLAILGAVAYVVMRGRNGQQPGFAGVPGEPGGFGPGGQPGQATGRYGAVGPFGARDPFGQPGGFSDPAIGGVAQWGDDEPRPGADWQPRPMSGSRRDFDDPEDSGYSGGSGAPDAPLEPWADAPGTPADPWGATSGGGYTQPRRPGGEGGGTTNPTGPWDDQWGTPGPGSTRPSGGG